MGIIDYKALYEASLRENAALEEEKIALEKAGMDLEESHALDRASWAKEKAVLEEERSVLIADLNNLRRQIFGIRSDKQVKLGVAGQLDLFNLKAPAPLIEQVGKELQEAIKKQQDKAHKAPRKPKRMSLPEHIERKEVVIDPKGDLSDYKVIGSDCCEVLVIEPLKMWVKHIVRRKWALKNSMDIHKTGIIIAPAPSRTVKSGLFDESVLAFLLVSKYTYHLPLHRIKQMFTREKIPISSSTLSDNVAATIRALEPIYRALIRETLAAKYLQSDETTYKVLRSGTKGKCHNGYMWAFHSPPDGLLFFKYCESRAHIHPKKMLENFQGVLQSDAYAGYSKALSGNPDIKHLFCLAHLRRKFDESAGNDLARAKTAIDYIASMYAIEKVIRETQPAMAEDKIVFLRNKEVLPIMDKMKGWMEQEYPKILPKSPIGKALAYGLKIWKNMYTYLLHGDLMLDNNEIENAMRPIALSRKNSLFSGTHQTAQDAAMIFSLFETCKRHNVDTQNWLTDVLYKINDPDFEGSYSDLMPHRWKNTP
ncbi:MAG: IS66 family transposase [Sphingobacterium sp.]|uniref:IS66 family transposase n=1 Tax=Sphingobacterium sp. JB170 TaxID=1434842 RepID=UPI00097E9C84|nr:IS66 family transposase [Sphingobacterium sp. JB170]SJN49025.1 Mobile element protein [Sphingobacterium sp. JB170]